MRIRDTGLFVVVRNIAIKTARSSLKKIVHVVVISLCAYGSFSVRGYACNFLSFCTGIVQVDSGFTFWGRHAFERVPFLFLRPIFLG